MEQQQRHYCPICEDYWYAEGYRDANGEWWPRNSAEEAYLYPECGTEGDGEFEDEVFVAG